MMRLLLVLFCASLATSQQSNEVTITEPTDSLDSWSTSAIATSPVTESYAEATFSGERVQQYVTQNAMAEAEIALWSVPVITTPATQNYVEATVTEGAVEQEVSESEDGQNAMAELAEAVRSLLPLREYMAVAAECREGREVAMQNMIAELRGRLSHLERQLGESQHEERNCKAQFQAFRALGLEAQLAGCRAREDKTQVIIRLEKPAVAAVELANKESEESDEAKNETQSDSIQTLHQLLANALQTAGASSALESKIADIFNIAKETKQFMESLQESENDDQGPNEELTRVTAQLNVSETVQQQLREQLERLREKKQCEQLDCEEEVAEIRSQCEANLAARVDDTMVNCTRQVEAAVATAESTCDSERARLQSEGVSYIMTLHSECNASLADAQFTCEQEKEAYLAKINAMNIEKNYSLIVSMQTKCDEDKRELKSNLEERCDNGTLEIHSHCEAKIAHLASVADAEAAELKTTIHNLTQERIRTLRDSVECRGFDDVISNISEPGVNEFSFRMGERLYIVGDYNVSREEAWNSCREKDMWLLTLDKEDELTDLQTRIQMLAPEPSVGDHVFWIAARRDTEHSGWYSWECGSKPFIPWNSYNFGGDDCVAVTFPRQLGGIALLNNTLCDLKFQYVCEALVEEEINS